MNSQKSFIEIRESLKSLVEPKHIIYNPSYAWIVEVFNFNGELISQYKETTLYCIIGRIYNYYNGEELPSFLYILFEECISTGCSDFQNDDCYLQPHLVEKRC